MDNFGFLTKNELSYILNNEKIFGVKLLQQIEEYCQRNNDVAAEIKAKKPTWQEDVNRLNFNSINEEIVISKTAEAKRVDNFKFNYALIAIGLMVLVGIWMMVTKGKNSSDFWLGLIFIPVGAAMLIGVYAQRRKVKQQSQQNRFIRILKNATIQLVENGKVLHEKQLSVVNLFWEDDHDIGSSPKVKLELKAADRTAFLIDEEGDYLELVRCGNEISQFLNIKLVIFRGESPFKEKIEL